MKDYIKTKLSTLKSFATKAWRKFRALRMIYQIIIGVALLTIIIASKIFLGFGYTPQIKVVETHKVSKGNLLHTTRLLGTLEAKKLFSSVAGYEGTVSYVAPAGSNLKTGEVIAKIQNDAIENAYHSAVKAAQIAEEQYNRQIILFNSKTASRQTVEDKFSNLSAARSALVAAQMNYDKIVFVAPFDGTVGSAVTPVGSRAKTGDTIITFYDASEFVVKFDIASDYLKNLGTNASVSINEQEYKIDFIQKALSDGTYTAPAHVTFPCKTCISGEMVDVDLHLISKKDIIVVPTSCVFISDKEHFVYKVANGIANIGPVKLGIKEKDKVEITEGLAEGDEIVLKGQSRLHPGIGVKVFEEKETP
jgi:membrane fusion protein (multidrug efflux system)